VRGKKVAETTLQTPQLRSRGKRCSRCWNRDSPAAHGENYAGADRHAAAHEGPFAGSMWTCPEGSCRPGRNCGLGRTTLEQPVCEVLYPMKRTQAGAVLEELQYIGSTHTSAVCAWLYPMGGTPHYSMGTVRAGRNRDKVWGINCNPSFPTLKPPAPFMAEAAEKYGKEEWSWAWEDVKGEGKVFLVFLFVSHYATLFSSGSKLMFPKSTVSPMTVTRRWSPCHYLEPQAFPAYFLHWTCWGEVREAGWAPGSQPNSTNHNYLFTEVVAPQLLSSATFLEDEKSKLLRP